MAKKQCKKKCIPVPDMERWNLTLPKDVAEIIKANSTRRTRSEFISRCVMYYIGVKEFGENQ